VPTPDTAALAARLMEAASARTVGYHEDFALVKKADLTAAADALAALAAPSTVTAKLTATPSGNTTIRLGSVTTARDVAAFVRGAEWAAQRYTATGEQDFYAIAERAARGEHVPPTGPAPSVAEARQAFLRALQSDLLGQSVNTADAAFDALLAAIRADVPPEVREIATRVARETDGERDDVTVAVLDEMGRVGPIARVRDLRALARHGLGET